MMSTVKRFFSITRLWVLALPLLLIGVGAGLNQAVLVANHDKFPVMVNERKTVAFAPDKWGIIDDEAHCVMTKDTHLNWLADYIDLKEAIYSPGDLILELGEYADDYASFAWGLLVITDLLRRKPEQES